MSGAKGGFIRELKLLLVGLGKKSPVHFTKNQSFENERGFIPNEIPCNRDLRV
jgi:hypothetical protein